MMSDKKPLKHVEQLRNNGIVNCPTQLHLVGHFYKICIMMHGSMNVTLTPEIWYDETLWIYGICLEYSVFRISRGL